MFKIDDPDRFQKISSGIQSWLISIALLIGGGWTLYVFNSQLQVENSRAQLAKLNRELEASPRLELDINIQPFKLSKASNRHYFECRLVVKNVGTKSTILKFDDKPVRLYRVELDDQGQSAWNLVRSIDIPMSERKDDRLVFLSAQVNSTNYANWVIEIDNPGLYVLSVAAMRSPSETSEVLAAGARPGIPVFWGAERYFMVE